MKKIAVALMIGTLAFSCSKQETKQTEVSSTTTGTSTTTAVAATPVADTAATGTAATGTQQAAQAMAQAQAQGNLTGTIAETMDSGGYTYIKVKTATGEEWAATPVVKVKKGDKVTIAPQMTAEKFESTSLKRKFDRIVFGTVVTGNAPGSQMPPNHPGMGGSPSGMGGMAALGTPTDHMKAKVVGDVKVPKADGGKTVAEVWASRASLGDKEVVVRGKVVKYLGGIMGTNFIHLQDGTGSPEKGDDDLTITSNDAVKAGDVVTVKGIVHIDKDFGAGYRYPVIIENASISKQ